MARAGWLIFVNEFLLLARDRVGIFMLLLAPVVITLVAGLSLGNLYGAGPGRGAYIIAVIDQDHGTAAHALLSSLAREPSLNVVSVDSVASARRLLGQRDRTPLALMIPAGTTLALERGNDAQLVLYVDPVKRLEVSAIELRIDELCRRITAHMQSRAAEQFVQKNAGIRRQLEQYAEHSGQIQAVLKGYRRDILEQRKKVEASLNVQAQRAIAEFGQQTRAAVEQSAKEAKSTLAGEISARQAALATVSNYLSELQNSKRDFDSWLTSLKTIAGSHAAQISPPPAWPVAPSKEQLSELSKPIVLPEIVPPRMPGLPHLAIKLPELPQLPPIEHEPSWTRLEPYEHLPHVSYIDWREQPIAGESARPNAFDQYVPGFGITFLLIAMLMAIGMGLIDERDWGTLQRLRVSGAPLAGLLAGKLSARFIVGLIQMTVLFAVGWALFGISLGGNPAMLLVPTAAISFAAAAFSLVIACVARSHDSIMPIGAVAAMALSAIGGCWWPLDFEPGWMRAFARLLPTTWTMQAYNDLMIRHSAGSVALESSAFAAAIGLGYLIVGMVVASRLYEYGERR